MSPILIVDDDAELRNTLALLLAEIAVILEASDGPEALRLIAAHKPKLLLLDVSMPGLGGLAVLERALKIDPGLSVLMLTGECDIEIAKDALRLGARAYITKPFDGPGLRGQVEHLLGIISGEGDSAPYRPWRVA